MWTINRGLRVIAGTFILSNLTPLFYIHSKYWLLFTAFVGLNLFQSGFTNWCSMMKILRRFGFDEGELKECFINCQNEHKTEGNPINNLSLSQLKDILSGKIKNWKEVGGKDMEIKNVMLQPCVTSTVAKQVTLMALTSKSSHLRKKVIL